MGSKRKYCKDIVPIIQKYINDNNIEIFVDCFCGGANLTDKIDCPIVIGNDLSHSLITLHKKAQNDSQDIPAHGNREWWDKAYSLWKEYKKELEEKGKEFSEKEFEEKNNFSFWEIGAIEWYASFSNGGFPRGYAKPSHNRDYYNEAYRNHQKQAELENYKKIQFIQGDYKNIFEKIDISKNILFYCDSPYKGTKPYAINPKFNFEEYYNWLRETSKSFPIFISEQEMPEDFNIVWEKEAKRTAGKDNNFKAVEKLYLIGGNI